MLCLRKKLVKMEKIGQEAVEEEKRLGGHLEAVSLLVSLLVQDPDVVFLQQLLEEGLVVGEAGQVQDHLHLHPCACKRGEGGESIRIRRGRKKKLPRCLGLSER